jgi:hypothetical protein
MVRWCGNGILHLTGYSEAELELHHEVQERPRTLDQRIQQSPEGMRWAVAKYAVADGGKTLAEAICKGTAIAVCDGSFKDELGMAAYVLEGETTANRIVVVLVTPGNAEDQSSYRSELSGIFGVVVMVHLVCEHFAIKDGSIEVGCDCESALRQVFGKGPNFEPGTKDTDYDLQSAIRKMLENSPITWKWRHVTGHQDDDGIEELDRWARLNVEMDSLAKVYWNDMGDEQTASRAITNEYWPVSIRGDKVS